MPHKGMGLIKGLQPLQRTFPRWAPRDSVPLIIVALTLTIASRASNGRCPRHVGACQGIGSCRDVVNRRLDLLLVMREFLSTGLSRDVDRIAHDDAELREREVDGHPAPRIRRPIAGACDRKGNDGP